MPPAASPRPVAAFSDEPAEPEDGKGRADPAPLSVDVVDDEGRVVAVEMLTPLE